jgi:hypothetical protein
MPRAFLLKIVESGLYYSIFRVKSFGLRGRVKDSVWLERKWYWRVRCYLITNTNPIIILRLQLSRNDLDYIFNVIYKLIFRRSPFVMDLS